LSQQRSGRFLDLPRTYGAESGYLADLAHGRAGEIFRTFDAMGLKVLGSAGADAFDVR
jgi:hypothetical protein